MAKIMDPDFEFNADFAFKQDLRNLFLRYTYNMTISYNYLACYDILTDIYDRLYPKLKSYKEVQETIDDEYKQVYEIIKTHDDLSKMPRIKLIKFKNSLRKINQQLQIICQDKGYWLPDKYKGRNTRIVKHKYDKVAGYDGVIRDATDEEAVTKD